MRWILGYLVNAMGLSELTRRFYLQMARNFVRRLPGKNVEGAWVRRSVVTEDFKPIVSDIDLTILLNDRDLRPFSRSRLLQDVQILSPRFLKAWEETGGFRNYQLSQWKQIYGIPLKLNSPDSGKEERAFEVAYEVHLVFKQIAQKLQDKNFKSPAIQQDLRKLSLELQRLRLFWESGDNSWATRKRLEIPSPGTLSEVFELLELLCRSLIKELEPPLNVYDWSKTVIKENSLGYETAISFKGAPIFVLKDPLNVLQARSQKENTFIATGAYLQMMKGIGVQEQAHLNRLARENSYYRKFSCQRLAHDLIGALVLEPENIEQLYFCFYNISHFVEALSGNFPQDWPKIEAHWKLHGQLPWEIQELSRASTAYLDHLEALI